MSPIALGERTLDGEFASICWICENVRHVGHDFLSHPPNCIPEMLVKRVDVCLSPDLGAMDLPLAAVHACLYLPEFLLFPAQHLADPGLKVLLLDLESIVHGGPRDFAENPLDENGPKVILQLSQLVTAFHFCVQAIQYFQGSCIGHLSLLIHFHPHRVHELDPQGVDLGASAADNLWDHHGGHQSITHALLGREIGCAHFRVASNLMGAERLHPVEDVRLAKLSLQV
mmetsp:Transcript_65290/g.173133  ORF Transcript_65290/g.173133 Transcript_65290/m.173133 type:complete len:228 (+) Transcript_65290:1091-1774(+)